MRCWALTTGRCAAIAFGGCLVLLVSETRSRADIQVIPGGDTSGGTTDREHTGAATEHPNGCPPCGLLFQKVVENPDGTRVQNVAMQERGEPKSGTGFMLEWAGGALVHACHYLKSNFGQDSCRVDMVMNPANHELQTGSLVFEPRLGGDDALCPCETVDRVSLSVKGYHKHTLPIPNSCRWAHSSNVAGDSYACTYQRRNEGDGQTSIVPPANFTDLWHCMEENPCPVVDTDDQMVILRDPRAVAVSTFYYMGLHGFHYPETVDEYVLRMLPALAQWTAVRFILFEGLMPGRSTFLFYDDAMLDPLGWHQQWLFALGLQLPSDVIREMTKAAMNSDFEFHTKGVDKHPGGRDSENDESEHKTAYIPRAFESELKPETLRVLESILRRWLPPTLLVRFGVSGI